MDLTAFEAYARRVFEEIPSQYREGVEGLVVERRALPHPTLDDVYTLGECRTEAYPSEYGGAGDVRSAVVLYYGSFLELARRSDEDEWDWEGEIWETVTHEVRHHLESLALDDALEVLDYAEDQNFARREGRPFEPFFYRDGEPIGGGAFEVDGDVFLERTLTDADFERMGILTIEWEGREYRGPRPDSLGDVHFVTAAGVAADGELVLVLVRRSGLVQSIRKAVSRTRPVVLHSSVPMEEVR